MVKCPILQQAECEAGEDVRDLSSPLFGNEQSFQDKIT